MMPEQSPSSPARTILNDGAASAGEFRRRSTAGARLQQIPRHDVPSQTAARLVAPVVVLINEHKVKRKHQQWDRSDFSKQV